MAPSSLDRTGLGADALGAVDRAEAHARSLGSSVLGTEHLLVGIITGSGAAADALLSAGATVAATRAKVAETAGVPAADAVEPQPSSRATRAVGRAQRLSYGERSEEVRARHLLVGLLDVEGTAGQVLRGIGVDVPRLREALVAAGTTAPVPPPAVEDDVAVGPRCPSCGADVRELAFSNIAATDADGRTGEVVVFSCRACGGIVGVTPRRQARD